jgi:hypothetical protein
MLDAAALIGRPPLCYDTQNPLHAFIVTNIKDPALAQIPAMATSPIRWQSPHMH